MPPGAERAGAAPRTVRAVRGATVVAADTPAALHAATAGLLRELVARNALAPDDVVSALFTVTPDLTSAFPATAARALGWADVPMLCAQEIPVPGALARCLRVLLHVETVRARHEMAHAYLGAAAALRPDLADGAANAPDGAGATPARRAHRRVSAVRGRR